MNKKIWPGFIAVFLILEVLDYIIHGLVLESAYTSLTVWRPDMMSKIWITHLVTLIGAFFFAFIFSKGYENKGIGEGLRYGLYIGIWMSVGMAYGTYAMIAIPYSLALEWFLFGIVEYVIAGAVLAMVFGSKGKSEAKV